METERADFRFTVKESGTGKLSIMLEPGTGGLGGLGYLMLDLNEVATLEEASALARMLTTMVVAVSHTA